MSYVMSHATRRTLQVAKGNVDFCVGAASVGLPFNEAQLEMIEAMLRETSQLLADVEAGAVYDSAIRDTTDPSAFPRVIPPSAAVAPKDDCWCHGADHAEFGPKQNLVETIQALRDAGGDAWDAIGDPESFLGRKDDEAEPVKADDSAITLIEVCS